MGHFGVEEAGVYQPPDHDTKGPYVCCGADFLVKSPLLCQFWGNVRVIGLPVGG